MGISSHAHTDRERDLSPLHHRFRFGRVVARRDCEYQGSCRYLFLYGSELLAASKGEPSSESMSNVRTVASDIYSLGATLYAVLSAIARSRKGPHQHQALTGPSMLRFERVDRFKTHSSGIAANLSSVHDARSCSRWRQPRKWLVDWSSGERDLLGTTSFPDLETCFGCWWRPVWLRVAGWFGAHAVERIRVFGFDEPVRRLRAAVCFVRNEPFRGETMLFELDGNSGRYGLPFS